VTTSRLSSKLEGVQLNSKCYYWKQHVEDVRAVTICCC